MGALTQLQAWSEPEYPLSKYQKVSSRPWPGLKTWKRAEYISFGKGLRCSDEHSSINILTLGVLRQDGGVVSA